MSKYAGKLITNQAPAGYSVFFDGSGDYLTVPAGSAFAPGTGNFTIEAWVYPTASGNRFIWTQTVSGTNYFVFAIDTTAYLTMTASGGGTGIIGPANSIKQNAWNHIAAVRVSGTVTVYVNGVGGTPTSNTLDLSNTTYTPTIGTYTHSTASDVFTGYMSNLRYVKGTALYTANFTPPTQLFNVTNTSLLTCNSPALIDQGTANSGSGFPITANGNAAVSTFTPFTAYVPYNPALGASTPGVWTLDEAMQAAATRQWNMYDPYFQNTTLLLHGNPTNGTSFITDASTNNFTVTPNGDVRAANLSPFSLTTFATSGSAYFDGTGDFVNLGGQSAFSFGTGDWTVEFWMNFSATGGTLFDTRPAGTASTNGYSVLFLSSGSVRYDTASGVKITGSTLSANTWYHVALSKASGVTRLFINGVQDGSSYTDSVNYGVGANRPIIGADGNVPTAVLFTGYLSNYRIVKGVGVYTGAFTTPTAPLTAVQAAGTNISAITGTQTSLLTLQNSQSANNNAFLDSSSNNFLITRNPASGPSAPTQGSFSPFSQTGWGNYLNGSTDYFRVSDNAAFDFGTGAFCIEMWFMLTADAAQNGETNREANLLAAFPDSGALATTYTIGIGGNSATTGTAIAFSIRQSDTIAYNQIYTATITKNVWHHIAVCRSGNDFAMFYDGLRVSSNASYTYTVNTNHSVKIGALIYPTYNHYFPGYISNLRIVKGASVYAPTSLSIAVPTEPLGTTSGGQTPPTGTQTSLLTCQSNRFVDNSTANSGSGFTITVNGTPSVQAFSPFYPTAAYTPQTIGGSGYFDGTGDYLVTSTTSAAFAYGTGDFTYSAWIYPTNVSGFKVLIDGRRSADKVGPVLYLDNATLTGAKNETTNVLAGGTVIANAWNFVELTRTSSNWRLFVNGSLTAGPTADAINYSANQLATVGANGMDASQGFAGYIADARVLKGTGGTSSTMPTSPLTNITNTSLLLNFTNAGIVDSTAKNVLETVGNAQISTTQSKFGGSSMSFDGTGDYIVEPTNLNFGYGTGDFTIEFWLRLNSTATQTVVSNLTSASSVNPHLYVLSGGSIRYYTANADRITGSTLSANQWYHVALCRSGTSTRLFIDGTQSGSTYTDSNNYGTTAPLGIGTYWASGAPVTADTLNGYIDDLRITRFARYTANFTPQTSQWQDR